MAGFQFTPDGIVPLDAEPGAQSVAMHPARPPKVEAVAPAPATVQRPTVAPVAQVPDAPAPVHVDGTGDVIKAARARLKWLKAELKRFRAVKREHDELERLLKAARQKPAPKVRQLRSA